MKNFMDVIEGEVLIMGGGKEGGGGVENDEWVRRGFNVGIEIESEGFGEFME